MEYSPDRSGEHIGDYRQCYSKGTRVPLEAVVLYEWLAGARPFQGTVPAIALQHLHAPPPSLRDQVPTLPVHVEQVVFQALIYSLYWVLTSRKREQGAFEAEHACPLIKERRSGSIFLSIAVTVALDYFVSTVPLIWAKFR